MTAGRERPSSGRRADEEALGALASAYAWAADSGDGPGLAALFVEDGELVVPDYPDDLRPVITRAGHDALGRIPGQLRRYARTFHVVGNRTYDVDGDRASGRVQCVAHHVSADPDVDRRGGTDTVWYLEYHDDYRRSDGNWRIVRRALHLHWVEERPVALVGDLPADRVPEDGAGR